jgi:catechol 2,3-dioxygenase-like lactoylglutathione lyase family enzyme
MADPLDLGCFSMSLCVADLDRSLAFYEALGFSVIGGEDRWRILSNGPTKLGLFEEEIETNILTFNPGLEQDWPGQDGVTEAAGPGGAPGMPTPKADFTDVREIERRLVDAGIELTRRTTTESGPDHITLADPDGNQILIDQFF